MNQLLVYGDGTVTDNPHERAFDHRRRVESIIVKNPDHKTKTLRPGESFQVFENTINVGLSGTSVLDLSLASQEESIYRLALTAGTGAFKTARTSTGFVDCSVTVNNNAMAVFDFGVATTGAQVGDIMRILSQAGYDQGTIKFNPVNGGLWKVIGVQAGKVSVIRLAGQPFQGLQETVTGVTGQVEFFADDKVMKGDKIAIDTGFSIASARTYEVLEATPTQIIFISTMSIPEETGITYQTGGIILYTGTKKIVYIEADQEVVVRFNGATDNSNKITPLKAGDRKLPGYLHKVGDTYSCSIVNNTINSVNVLYFTCE